MNFDYARDLARIYGIDIEIDSTIPGLDDTTGVEAVSVFAWNKVAFFPDNIQSQERLNQVARHEILGHFAMRRCLSKDELAQICREVSIHHSGSNLFCDIVRVYGYDPDVVGEEIMASMAEQHNHHIPDVMYAKFSTPWIRNFLKKCSVSAMYRTYHDERNLEFACCRTLR